MSGGKNIHVTFAEPLYDLYAENARPAAGRDCQVCPVCRLRINPGDRVADLAGGRGVCHTACIAVAAARSGERH